MPSNYSNTKHRKKNGFLVAVGTILLVVLLSILIINCTIIVKSLLHENEIPSVFGVFPMIVMTGSMEPEIMTGDMIICKTADTEQIQEGDIISFFDPLDNGSAVITHRVVKIQDLKSGNGKAFVTKGDANNGEDSVPVKDVNVIGKYVKRIPKLGNIAMFMQTTTGLVLCVILPLVGFISYDVIIKKKNVGTSSEDTETLLLELEQLRKKNADLERSRQSSEE